MTATIDEKVKEKQSLCISDLPNEILEQILRFLSPYKDFKSAMLVCQQWHRVMQGVISQEYASFRQSVSSSSLEWCGDQTEGGSTSPTERYSHSACYHDKSMYVFGGCTSSQTTFNDLWKYDLGTRQWIRPLAIGTYPSPKACASMVAYQDNLVLFGGWSHPTPYPLQQAARFFNQLHLYKPACRRWSHVTTHPSPPGKAGHAAAVLRDLMIVFGGSHGHGVSCNDTWVLDLRELTWHKRDISNSKPLPRYGHSQVTIDDSHMLVIGGCGGPNTQLSDVWLLSVDTEPWTWTEMKVLQPEHAPPQLWCHPACKVGDKVIVLSKSTRPCRPSPSSSGGVGGKKLITRPTLPDQPTPGTSRMDPPPPPPPIGKTDEEEEDLEGVVGRVSLKGQLKRSRPETSESSSQESDQDEVPVAGVGQHSYKLPTSPPRASSGGYRGASGGRQRASSGGSRERNGGSREPSPNTEYAHHRARTKSRSEEVAAAIGRSSVDDTVPGPTPRLGQPGVRPNAMKNRQKQLETLKKYEEKLRNKMAKPCYKPVPQKEANSMHKKVQNPMFLHVLDISRAVSDFTVTWVPVRDTVSPRAPEETIFYSLVEGRGELIMFGGIHTDLNGMQRGLNVNLQFVSNDTHFLTAPRIMR